MTNRTNLTHSRNMQQSELRANEARKAADDGVKNAAEKKRALDSASRAFEHLRDDMLDGVRSSRTEVDGRWLWAANDEALSDDLPFDLHQWRSRHSALARAAGFNKHADQIEALVVLRDRIKALPVVKRAERKLDTSDKVALSVFEGLSGAEKQSVLDAQVAKGPIALAVRPLREAARERARVDANAMVERVFADLMAHDWKLEAAAPYPSYRDRQTMGREAHDTARSKHALYQSLTTSDADGRVKPCAEKVQRHIEVAEWMAVFSYDSFTMKLIMKVGETKAATLTGNHVWGFSELTVTLPSGDKQRWRTQQIVNCSVLGKLFNQWPTRQVGR